MVYLSLLKLFQIALQIDMTLFIDDIYLSIKKFSKDIVKVFTASGVVITKNATTHHFVI